MHAAREPIDLRIRSNWTEALSPIAASRSGASSISCGGARPTTGRGRAQLAERLSLEHPLRLPERSTGDAPPRAHAADVGARDGRRVLPTRGLQRGGFR